MGLKKPPIASDLLGGLEVFASGELVKTIYSRLTIMLFNMVVELGQLDYPLSDFITNHGKQT